MPGCASACASSSSLVITSAFRLENFMRREEFGVVGVCGRANIKMDVVLRCWLEYCVLRGHSGHDDADAEETATGSVFNSLV